jgi:hypothetical protein
MQKSYLELLCLPTDMQWTPTNDGFVLVMIDAFFSFCILFHSLHYYLNKRLEKQFINALRATILGSSENLRWNSTW